MALIQSGKFLDSDLQLIENHEILSNISQYGDCISTSLLPKETELSESDIDYDKAHLEPKSITQIWINEDENLNECPRLFGEFDGEFFNGCLPETQELPIEKPYFKSVKSYLLGKWILCNNPKKMKSFTHNKVKDEIQMKDKFRV